MRAEHRHQVGGLGLVGQGGPQAPDVLEAADAGGTRGKADRGQIGVQVVVGVLGGAGDDLGPLRRLLDHDDPATGEGGHRAVAAGPALEPRARQQVAGIARVEHLARRGTRGMPSRSSSATTSRPRRAAVAVDADDRQADATVGDTTHGVPSPARSTTTAQLPSSHVAHCSAWASHVPPGAATANDEHRSTRCSRNASSSALTANRSANGQADAGRPDRARRRRGPGGPHLGGLHQRRQPALQVLLGQPRALAGAVHRRDRAGDPARSSALPTCAPRACGGPSATTISTGRRVAEITTPASVFTSGGCVPI